MSQVFEAISRIKVVPVVALENAELAEPLTDALVAGGLPLSEITLRTKSALTIISRLAARDDFLLGAGTVLTKQQCKSAIDAGAQFIVSPGLDLAIVEQCRDAGVEVFPGVMTASEVQLAIRHGVNTLKFFPAEAAGGQALLKAFAGPFDQTLFMPTGGISAGNAMDYLALPNVFAVGGSWMVQPALYASGDFRQVEQVSREIVTRIESDAPKR